MKILCLNVGAVKLHIIGAREIRSPATKKMRPAKVKTPTEHGHNRYKIKAREPYLARVSALVLGCVEAIVCK